MNNTPPRNIAEARSLAAMLAAFATDTAKLDAAAPDALLRLLRVTLQAGDRIARAVARQQSAREKLEYEGLSTAEATRRLLWQVDRPLTLGEIWEQISARGWRSRPSKTPRSTLRTELDTARLQFCKREDDLWELTPQGEMLELTRVLVAAKMTPAIQSHKFFRGWIQQLSRPRHHRY